MKSLVIRALTEILIQSLVTWVFYIRESFVLIWDYFPIRIVSIGFTNNSGCSNPGIGRSRGYLINNTPYRWITYRQWLRDGPKFLSRGRSGITGMATIRHYSSQNAPISQSPPYRDVNHSPLPLIQAQFPLFISYQWIPYCSSGGGALQFVERCCSLLLCSFGFYGGYSNSRGPLEW